MTTIVALDATTATGAPNALAHPIEVHCVAGMETKEFGLDGTSRESAHDPAVRGASLQALAVGVTMAACVAHRSQM